MFEKGISNGASTELRRGSVVTPTGSTEIRARDQMVCNSVLQQIAIALFGLKERGSCQSTQDVMISMQG